MSLGQWIVAAEAAVGEKLLGRAISTIALSGVRTTATDGIDLNLKLTDGSLFPKKRFRTECSRYLYCHVVLSEKFSFALQGPSMS